MSATQRPAERQNVPYKYATGVELRDSYHTVAANGNAENVGIRPTVGFLTPPSFATIPGMPRFRNPMQGWLNPRLARGSSTPSTTATNSNEGALNVGVTAKPVSCSCQRPTCMVKCSTCGHHYEGRVRLRCPVHHSQIYLMDNEVCPSCKCTSLKEYPK